jgi:hypothetical protein
VLCESVEMAILIPAARTSLAFSADTSSRSGLELSSKKQPIFFACSMMRSKSSS